jgi:CheY-specific phosphatase CheX
MVWTRARRLALLAVTEAAALISPPTTCSSVLRQIWADVLLERFAGFGLQDADPESVGITGDSFAAVLGFAGTNLRGAISIELDAALARASHPTPDVLTDATTREALRDWAGETANLLVGRLKNRVLPWGVELMLSTPTAVAGRDLDWSTKGGQRLAWNAMTGPAGRGRFLLRAEIDQDRELTLTESEACADEGELMLF